MRVKAIKGWDKLLTWTLAPKNPPYQLKVPFVQKDFQVKTPNLANFDQNYGYFSIYHPIVGIVTKSLRDIEVTNCLLESIHTEIKDPEQCHFSSEEILAKVMAYRPLLEGMKIAICSWNAKGEKSLQTYLVDKVLDLWHGMPAFGLVPEKKGEHIPILLFRGTDLSLNSEKGWASILSDLDTSGPGYTTFLQGQQEIHHWLEKMVKEKAPARLVGFSLGGVFVYYTMIHEYDLVNQEVHSPSIAFNSPGLSKEMLKKWGQVPDVLKPPLITYVNQGDIVSQIGFFLSTVWEVALPKPMQVIQAHTSLISTQPSYQMRLIDVELENESRQKR